MVKNIVSYSHLKNECLFNSREEAISGLTAQGINDGVIKLARYYDEDMSIKTIFGISYTYPNSNITTYTIYDNEQTKGDLTVTLSAYTPTESGSTIATRYTLYQGGKSLGNIDIYKDSFLESVELVYDEQGKAKWLRFTFILSDGTEKTVDIPLDSFIQDLEAGQGLYVDDDGSINIGKDETSEEFLQVNEDSIAVVGVHNAIDATVADLDATVSNSGNSGHVGVEIVEEDGKLVSVTVTEDDIASADDIEELSAKTVTEIGSSNNSISATSASATDGTVKYDIVTDADKIQMSGFSADSTSALSGIVESDSIATAFEKTNTVITDNERVTAEALIDLDNRIKVIGDEYVSGATMNNQPITVTNKVLGFSAVGSENAANGNGIVITTNNNGGLTFALGTLDAGTY